MANIGMPYYGYNTYRREEQEDGSFTEVHNEGRMTKSIITFTSNVTTETASLYAGDAERETNVGAAGGDVSIERSYLSLQEEAEITGNELDEDGVYHGKVMADPPLCRVGTMTKEQDNNAQFYRVHIKTAVKFQPPSAEYATGKKTPEYKTPTLKGNVTGDMNEEHEIKKDFAKAEYEDALAFFKKHLHIKDSVKKPTATPIAGIVTKDTKVTLTASEGMEIRYTTDGKDVEKAAATLYNAPITVSETMTIKARAYDPSDAKGPSLQFVGEYIVSV